MKRIGIGSAALVASSLLIVACGGGDDAADDTLAPATPPSTTVLSTGSGAASFNDADVEFAQGMIAHHQQAVEMAEMALDPNAGASPEVLDLANRVQAAQDPEIAVMTGWLTAWGQPVTMDTAGGHEYHSMEGMMTAEEMDALSAEHWDGIRHDVDADDDRPPRGRHRGVRVGQGGGSNPDVLALADQIITA